MLGNTEVWGFQPNYITKKLASHFLFNSLAALVTHAKCLQVNPKLFQLVVMKFLFN